MTLVLLLLVACIPQGAGLDDSASAGAEHHPTEWLADHWTETTAACQPPDPFYVSNESDEFWALHFHDEACLARIDADLGIDTASFDAAEDEWMLRITRFAAYALLGADMGTLAELDSSGSEWHDWTVRQSFRDTVHEVAEVLGESEVRQIVYNLVASTIQTTRFVDDEDIHAVASFDIESRTLQIYPQRRAWSLSSGEAAALVHEAMHGWLNRGHVECPASIYDGHSFGTALGILEGNKACDADWSGAYGHQIGVLGPTLEHYPSVEDDEGDDQEKEEMYDKVVEASFYILSEWEEGGAWAESDSSR